MGITFKVSSNVNNTSFPNPNTLTLVDPFNAADMPNGQVSQAWTTQGVKAYFPKSLRKSKSGHISPETTMPFSLTTTNPINTITVTVWYFDKVSRVWVQPKDNPTQTYTGSIQDDVFLRTDIPFYLQFSNPSEADEYTLSVDVSDVWVL